MYRQILKKLFDASTLVSSKHTPYNIVNSAPILEDTVTITTLPKSGWFPMFSGSRAKQNDLPPLSLIPKFTESLKVQNEELLTRIDIEMRSRIGQGVDIYKIVYYSIGFLSISWVTAMLLDEIYDYKQNKSKNIKVKKQLHALGGLAKTKGNDPLTAQEFESVINRP